MTEGVEIEGKKYISSKRAAELTGYAKDYVGQLCRMGKLDAKLIGRNWLVSESSLMEHRFGAEAGRETPVSEGVVTTLQASSTMSPGLGGIVSPFTLKAPVRRQPVFRTPIGARFYPGQVLFYNDDRPLNIELTLKPSVQALKDDAKEYPITSLSGVGAAEQPVVMHIVDPAASRGSEESSTHREPRRAKGHTSPKIRFGFAGALGMSAALSMMILAVGLGALLVGTRQVTELEAGAGGSKITRSYFVDFSI